MPATTIFKKDERKKEGLPEVKFTSRGNMYSSPQEIITSEKGKTLIYKLSKLKFADKREHGKSKELKK